MLDKLFNFWNRAGIKSYEDKGYIRMKKIRSNIIFKLRKSVNDS